MYSFLRKSLLKLAVIGSLSEAVMALPSPADPGKLILSCHTLPGSNSQYDAQFQVIGGYTHLFLVDPDGLTISHDQSADASGGYTLVVEGVYAGTDYSFDTSSRRLVDHRNPQQSEVLDKCTYYGL